MTTTVTIRPTLGEVETRSAPAAVAAPATGRTLTGLVPFGVVADLGDRTEEIAPGAFDGCSMDELVACVEHDDTRLLARHPGTLKVEITDDGLRWTATLPDTREAAETRALVHRGDLAACSWRMVVGDEMWRGSHRIIRRIARLLDVSPVARPAYGTAAGIELRSQQEAAGTHTEEEGGGRMADEQAAETADNTNNNSTDGGTYDVGGTLTLTPPDDGGEQVEQRSAPAQGGGGGLRVADVQQTDDTARPVADRIVEAMRAVPRGEARSLTTADTSAGPIVPDDLSATVWDRLRTDAVVLKAGTPIITTARHTVKLPVVKSDAASAFYTEGTEITADDPELEQIEVTPAAIKSLVLGSSEAFDDSQPDLAQVLRDNLMKVHALRLDRELLVGDGTGGGFVGLVNVSGAASLDATDADAWDALLNAAALLRGSGANGKLAIFAHPYVIAALDLLKDTGATNVYAPRPAALPAVYESTQLPRDATASTSTAVVVDVSKIAVVRRLATEVLVDRSAEFSSDRIAVRAKTRAALAAPIPDAIAVVENLSAPVPTA